MNKYIFINSLIFTVVLLVSGCDPATKIIFPETSLVDTEKPATAATIEKTRASPSTPEAVEATIDSPIVTITEEQDNQKLLPSEEPVITFQRSGGFASISEEWRIYEDGLITSLTGLTWRIDPQKVSQQVEELKAWGFFELESEYMPENTCCDRYSYIITVEHDGQENRVETMDGVEDMPHSLWVVLQSMNAFINELRIDPDLTPQA